MSDNATPPVHLVSPDSAEDFSVTPVMPDIKTVFLGGLFVLALLTACRAASEILLPVTLAFVLKMVLEPLIRTMGRIGIPRMIAAVLLMLVLFGGLIGVGSFVATPALDWSRNIPNILVELQQKLSFVQKPVQGMAILLDHAQGLTGGTKPLTVAVQGEGFSDHLLMNTRAFITGMFQTVLVLFFLLIAGDTFLRRLVEILPRFQDKRQAVDISQQTERDISAYLATITGMNALVGFATFLMMWVCRVEDPALWGIAAFLLNYVPIIGPTLCLALFVLVGLLSKTVVLGPFAPALFYLIINIVEGVNITPMLLAKRFTLNPVLVILSLIFWYWMWGIPGAILSTPMLAIIKIICDRIQSLKAFGHFLEGENRRTLATVSR